jgi:hypothetical protein
MKNSDTSQSPQRDVAALSSNKKGGGVFIIFLKQENRPRWQHVRSLGSGREIIAFCT